MAHLDNLPDETLLQIFSYLIKQFTTFRCNNNNDLTALALVTPRFSNLVRPLLLRKIILGVGFQPKLTRSIDESPSLGLLVHELHINWRCLDQGGHDEVNGILRKLKNVRVLNISALWDTVPFVPTFLDGGRLEMGMGLDKRIVMDKLERLTIRDTNLTVGSMARYMFHGSLQSLEVVWVEERDCIPTLPEEYILGTSSLRHLAFSPYFHLSAEVLGEILKWPRALESLSCGQTGTDVPIQKRLRTMLWKEPSTPFSPASMERALSSAKTSLRTLWIANCEDYIVKIRHDGSRLSLRMMKELRHVDVQMSWFSDTFEGRDNLYKLLPPKLEVLKLHLGRPGFGVARVEVDDENGEDGDTCLNPDFWWLMNIASHKREHFPSLREIHMDERDVQLPYDTYGYCQEYWKRRWQPPKVIARVFQATNIELLAMVYRKNPNGPTYNSFYAEITV